MVPPVQSFQGSPAAPSVKRSGEMCGFPRKCAGFSRGHTIFSLMRQNEIFDSGAAAGFVQGLKWTARIVGYVTQNWAASSRPQIFLNFDRKTQHFVDLPKNFESLLCKVAWKDLPDVIENIIIWNTEHGANEERQGTR